MSPNESRISKFVRYGSYGLVAYGVWQGVDKAQSLSVKTVTESEFYQRYRAFFGKLKQLGIIPAYVPKGLEGKPLIVGPSNAPPVYHEPPTTVTDSRILQPLKLRGLTLRNRIIRGAAFDGAHEEEIIQTHVEQSKGGVGMTTVAYCCVAKGGKSFDEQLVMEESNREFLQKLTTSVHEHGAAICAQLTHGGGFADREVTGEIQLAPSAVFNIAGLNWPKAMDELDLTFMRKAFYDAAVFVKSCGFDCVEIHCGHGYLLSQFLSPYFNKRTDDYGGNPENRARFPAEIVRTVRRAVGDDFPILVKLNMHDGHNGGMELEEAIVAANMIADASADALVLTVGQVTLNGFYMMRGGLPLEKVAQALQSPVERIAAAAFGPVVIPQTEFDDCFLRESARAVLKAVGHKIPICLMGGISSLSAMEGAMYEGFTMVQVIRSLIREPDFVNRITASLQLNQLVSDEIRKPINDIQSKCIRCNLCVIATVDPTAEFGCPFQRRDARERESNGQQKILSVQGMKDLLQGPGKIPMSTNLIPDVEDMFLSTKL